MISIIFEYSFISSLIICFIGFLMFLAWIFGTDTFDSFQEHFNDSDFVCFCWSHLIAAGCSTVIWFTSLHDLYALFLVSCVINTWMVFITILSIGSLILDMCCSVRNYCLKKRGKL